MMSVASNYPHDPKIPETDHFDGEGSVWGGAFEMIMSSDLIIAPVPQPSQ